MGDCELLADCPFFNDMMLYSLLGLEAIKDKYCRSDYSRCARHVVYKALGRETVPPDLFPVQHDTAERIISKC